MEWFVRAFIRSSLAWFGLGVTLGVAMAAYPPWAMYRTAHIHMNLLGFVTMMIFGVAYHVMPRFSGNPLHSRRLATVHWWLANAGLACFTAGLLALPHRLPGARLLVIIGGTVSAASAYAFIYNVWRTVDGRRATSSPAASAVPEAVLVRRSAGIVGA